MTNPSAKLLQEAELGDLLCGLVRAIMQAQDTLDQHASQLATQYVDVPDGTLAIPPVWYAVKDATVELEMSASFQNTKLQCRLVNPSSVGLYGYSASAGARVRLIVGPSGVVPIHTAEQEPDHASD